MAKDFILKSDGDGQERHEKIVSNIISKFPIELEKKITTLDKPLVIASACPGWQPKMWPPKEAYQGNVPVVFEEGGVRYPAVPCTIEEQASEQIKAVKAGCSAVHIHPRDPQDCFATNSLELLAQVYDKIFEQIDVISLQHTWRRTDDGSINYIEDTSKLLQIGNGNKYCQSDVVLWPPSDSYPQNYVESAQKGVRFMEENNVKAIIKVRSTYHLKKMKRALIDTGIITKEPLVISHDMGHPFGWPMDVDPWMPIELVSALMQTKQIFPGSVIGVSSGNRNWMPITMTAILAGVDFVQVGIEDCFWMYPHKDEVIQSNIDAVNKIVKFCELIGREIASVDKARELLGIEKK